MKSLNLIKSGFGALLVAALIVVTVGCSGDDNPVNSGPAGTAGLTYDDIIVSLDKLEVKYDCDYNPVGVTQPGDFRYYLNVDTLSDDGVSWLRASSNREARVELNNGASYNVGGQKASFRFPRRDGQTFQVRMSIREVDSGGDDFKSNHYVTHIYSSASTQKYAPEGANYTSWNTATGVGTMNWNVNKRDRTYVLGVLTKEGCNVTLNYSVTVRPSI